MTWENKLKWIRKKWNELYNIHLGTKPFFSTWNCRSSLSVDHFTPAMHPDLRQCVHWAESVQKSHSYKGEVGTVFQIQQFPEDSIILFLFHWVKFYCMTISSLLRYSSLLILTWWWTTGLVTFLCIFNNKTINIDD